MSNQASSTSSFPRWLWFALVFAAIAALPILVGGSAYWKSILISIVLNIMLAMSLNLILGYTGQLHLGHSGFFGVGAYATTLLIQKAGFNFWIAMVASSMMAGVIGILLAFFATRLKGHYLAIASMAFAVILHQILLNWDSMTSGPLGIYGIAPPPAILRIPLPGSPRPVRIVPLGGVGVLADDPEGADDADPGPLVIF